MSAQPESRGSGSRGNVGIRREIAALGLFNRGVNRGRFELPEGNDRYRVFIGVRAVSSVHVVAYVKEECGRNIEMRDKSGRKRSRPRPMPVISRCLRALTTPYFLWLQPQHLTRHSETTTPTPTRPPTHLP